MDAAHHLPPASCTENVTAGSSSVDDFFPISTKCWIGNPMRNWNCICGAVLKSTKGVTAVCLLTPFSQKVKDEVLQDWSSNAPPTTIDGTKSDLGSRRSICILGSGPPLECRWQSTSRGS